MSLATPAVPRGRHVLNSRDLSSGQDQGLHRGPLPSSAASQPTTTTRAGRADYSPRQLAGIARPTKLLRALYRRYRTRRR